MRKVSIPFRKSGRAVKKFISVDEEDYWRHQPHGFHNAPGEEYCYFCTAQHD
jgi:hypothetical protein